jgi:deoxyribonuclease-4
MLLGAHLSVAGGYYHALLTAERLKCNCLQIFVKNQRQWRTRSIDPEQKRLWFEHKKRLEGKISEIIAHSGYLINLAGDNASIRNKSIVSLVNEMELCHQLEIQKIVLHPGSHRGQGVSQGINYIISGLDKVFAESPPHVRILLETTAGAGHTIGGKIEDFSPILHSVKNPHRLGVCLDSCHLFASGYSLRTNEEFENFLTLIKKHIGLNKIGCIHLNDSKGALGSHLDRHEHIGKGQIPKETFRRFMTAKEFHQIPKIIETPKGDMGRIDLDRKNLNLLRKLAK